MYNLISIKVFVKSLEEIIKIHPNSESTVKPKLHLFTLKRTPKQKLYFASLKIKHTQ